ncbi:Alpha/Beta hydrolase protein [Pestalotiopsis sp. NC0098]|nr:Alpha/Beta hydrolase protein [Pestalotiopsis sp. NC0098]
MSSQKPVVLFIHGAYHPPSCYTRLIQKLETAGLEVVTPRLASLGEGVVGKTLDDDVAAVQTAAEALLAAGKEIVLVAHSYGGFVTINTVNKLSKPPKHVVYISAAFKAKGATCNDACNPSSAQPPDFDATFAIHMVGEQASVTLKDGEAARRYFLLPASKEDVDEVIGKLEPMCPDIFGIPSPGEPSELSVPQTFVVCGKDNIILPETQEKVVADAGLKAVRLPESGHAPYLNYAQELADTIIEVAS